MRQNLIPLCLKRKSKHLRLTPAKWKRAKCFSHFRNPNIKTTVSTAILKIRHKYIPSAFEKGAVACVVRPDRFEEQKAELEKFQDRLIFVEDSIAALQKLAHGVYLEWNKPVVAITGSAGKTTAKELTAHVLEHSGRKVLRNIKNYNNGLGTSFDGFEFGER